MSAYYNEFDPKAAAWLRELIKQGLIADGVVDERSIKEVQAHELAGYTQCHFFAGIGGWSYALRLAGWADDTPVWTGSCPCQPFSVAGKGKGEEDERHLWPAFASLIRECRPPVVFGEQVAGAIGHGWLDGVQADLEGEGYACGAAVLGAHSVGAPHIRQRLCWVADAGCQRDRDIGPGADPEAAGRVQGTPSERERVWAQSGECGGGVSGGLAHDQSAGLERSGGSGMSCTGRARERFADGSPDGGLGDANPPGPQGWEFRGDSPRERAPGPTGMGFWSAYDLLPCADGKARRIEPGTFPLAHGVPARVGRLRGYGNAIVPQVAAEFIRAYCEVKGA